jgi:hypothetical protein
MTAHFKKLRSLQIQNGTKTRGRGKFLQILMFKFRQCHKCLSSEQLDGHHPSKKKVVVTNSIVSSGK